VSISRQADVRRRKVHIHDDPFILVFHTSSHQGHGEHDKSDDQIWWSGSIVAVIDVSQAATTKSIVSMTRCEMDLKIKTKKREQGIGQWKPEVDKQGARSPRYSRRVGNKEIGQAAPEIAWLFLFRV
jgi:hypothetical protein